MNLLTHSADYIINLVLFAALSGDIVIVLVTQHMKLHTANPYTAIFYQTGIIGTVLFAKYAFIGIVLLSFVTKEDFH